MSDCGCKGGNKVTPQDKNMMTTFGGSIFVRVLIFLFSVLIVGIVLIPIVIPFMLIMLFNQIVLQKNTDVGNSLLKIGKFFKTSKKRVEENDDDFDNINDEKINPEDYELVDVDVIK